MDAGGLTAGFFQLLQGRFHRGAGGQHRVCHYEGFPLQGRAGAVVCVNLEIVSLAVFSPGGEETAFRPVEETQDTFLQRKAGPQDGGDYQGGIGRLHLGNGQRSGDLFLRIGKRFGNLISEDGAYPLQVDAETHPVFLDVGVPDFGDETVENGVGLSQIDDFHRLQT